MKINYAYLNFHDFQWLKLHQFNFFPSFQWKLYQNFYFWSYIRFPYCVNWRNIDRISTYKLIYRKTFIEYKPHRCLLSLFLIEMIVNVKASVNKPRCGIWVCYDYCFPSSVFIAYYQKLNEPLYCQFFDT